MLVFLANGGTRRQVYVAKTLIPRGTEIVHAYVHAKDPEVGRWVAPKAGRLEYSCRATDAVIKLRQGREKDGQEMPQKPGCAFSFRTRTVPNPSLFDIFRLWFCIFLRQGLLAQPTSRETK